MISFAINLIIALGTALTLGVLFGPVIGLKVFLVGVGSSLIIFAFYAKKGTK